MQMVVTELRMRKHNRRVQANLRSKEQPEPGSKLIYRVRKEPKKKL
jgi:hypothetical protein